MLWADFLPLRKDQSCFGSLAQHRTCMTGNGDDRDGGTAEVIDDGLELSRLAALRDQQGNVPGRRHSEVAVDRFRQVQEDRRRPRRGEGRCDLAPHMSRLA